MKKSLTFLAFLSVASLAFAASTTILYTTKAGDTLQSIAATYATTTAALLNGNPNLVLAAGQTLTVGYQAVVTPPITPPVTTGIVHLNTYTTGYGNPDNSCGNNGKSPGDCTSTGGHAGGTGTFADPITLAVGHVITGGKDVPDFPLGTKFYVPNLRRYFIAADLCGDGNTPQNVPCHNLTAKGDSAPAGATLWLDLWVGGVGQSVANTLKCEDSITNLHTVIENPASNYIVVPGQIFGTTCAAQFGETVVTQ